ncbi:MAG: hypothetical protein JO230_09280 [Xanthobacteraceae bacterium]|nr:hypothetical protein [Xanthobacteraceae bacterium]
MKDSLPRDAGQGGIGTPAQLREHLQRYERAGVDQIIFVQQSGSNQHAHICESLELFAGEVMPEFKQRDIARQAEKARALAPSIAAALARKPAVAPMSPNEILTVEAFGRNMPRAPRFSDRGGAIAAPTVDPHALAGGSPWRA